jgi:hypothetical protein
MYYDIATLQDEASPIGGAGSSSDFVEQNPIAAVTEGRTAGSLCSSVEISAVRLDEMVPLSFLNSLADFQAGRVVDIEIALNEPPPGA